MQTSRVHSVPVLFIGLLALVCGFTRISAGDPQGEKVVSALELTKVYADDPAEFDKKYKGKTVTVEGTVTGTTVKDAPVGGKSTRTFLLMDGYNKPGGAPYIVRCEESGPDFEGIRSGHKVRITGTVQGHSPTLLNRK